MSELIKKSASGTIGYHFVSSAYKAWYFSPFTGGKVKYFETEKQALAYAKRHAAKLRKESKP